MAALDARNVHSAGDLEMYDRNGLDRHRITAGVHAWFCGTVRHKSDKRPRVGWPCERGMEEIVRVYGSDPARRAVDVLDKAVKG